MACSAAWTAFYAEVTAFAVGDTAAAIATGGTLTPAIAVAAAAEIGALIASGMYVQQCLQQAGEDAQAAQMQQQLNTLQQEVNQLKQAAGSAPAPAN
jgi:hypothetical protein